MRFRHARLHSDALRRADAAPWRMAVQLGCPLCAQPYYLVTLPGLWEQGHLSRFVDSAERSLAWECPDHPHTFELEPLQAGRETAPER